MEQADAVYLCVHSRIDGKLRQQQAQRERIDDGKTQIGRPAPRTFGSRRMTRPAILCQRKYDEQSKDDAQAQTHFDIGHGGTIWG